MGKSTMSLAWKLLIASCIIVGTASEALAGGYKGALSSDTRVYDVTFVDDGSVRTETWFAQWVGNVYSKAKEAESDRVKIPLSERIQLCESASWIAPQRHIWKEGAEPYLTASHKLKLKRLEHRMRIVRCRRDVERTQGISRRALRSAREWIGSRNMNSVTFNRDNHEIGSVEVWLRREVPNVISIRLNRKESGLSAPGISS